MKLELQRLDLNEYLNATPDSPFTPLTPTLTPLSQRFQYFEQASPATQQRLLTSGTPFNSLSPVQPETPKSAGPILYGKASKFFKFSNNKHQNQQQHPQQPCSGQIQKSFKKNKKNNKHDSLPIYEDDHLELERAVIPAMPLKSQFHRRGSNFENGYHKVGRRVHLIDGPDEDHVLYSRLHHSRQLSSSVSWTSFDLLTENTLPNNGNNHREGEQGTDDSICMEAHEKKSVVNKKEMIKSVIRRVTGSSLL